MCILAQDIEESTREPWGSLSEVKGCVYLFLEYELDYSFLKLRAKNDIQY